MPQHDPKTQPQPAPGMGAGWLAEQAAFDAVISSAGAKAATSPFAPKGAHTPAEQRRAMLTPRGFEGQYVPGGKAASTDEPKTIADKLRALPAEQRAAFAAALNEVEAEHYTDATLEDTADDYSDDNAAGEDGLPNWDDPGTSEDSPYYAAYQASVDSENAEGAGETGEPQ